MTKQILWGMVRSVVVKVVVFVFVAAWRGRT